MTMGDNPLYAKLVVDVVIGPVLEQLEKKDVAAAQTLRAAFTKAEGTLPGLTYDLLRKLLAKGDVGPDKIDICETLLRLGGEVETSDVRLTRSEPIYVELNRCATVLKKILCKIPDEIHDRKQFLETIKDIASAIKTLLDAVNQVIREMPASDQVTRQILEDKKKDFVRYSKKFSFTLKEFFKDSRRHNVFVSANYLIYQTNLILKTVKQEDM